MNERPMLSIQSILSLVLAYGSGYGQVSLEQPAQQRQFLPTLPIQQGQSQIGYGQQQVNTLPMT